jgi:hypothetical protein
MSHMASGTSIRGHVPEGVPHIAVRVPAERERCPTKTSAPFRDMWEGCKSLMSRIPERIDRMTPIRVHVADTGSGARRVVISCACVKVGRVITRWEPMPEVVEQLLVDHRRQAPACHHPQPVGAMHP